LAYEADHESAKTYLKKTNAKFVPDSGEMAKGEVLSDALSSDGSSVAAKQTKRLKLQKPAPQRKREKR
jgi:hypothetical protein